MEFDTATCLMCWGFMYKLTRAYLFSFYRTMLQILMKVYSYSFKKIDKISVLYLSNFVSILMATKEVSELKTFDFFSCFDTAKL